MKAVAETEMMRYEAIMHNTGAQTERLCQPRYIRGFVLVAMIFEYVLRRGSIEYFREKFFVPEKSILLKKIISTFPLYTSTQNPLPF